jgi:hypothetical protein
MVYNTQSYWVSGLCPSSGILNTRKLNVSKAGCLSILRLGERHNYFVSSVEVLFVCYTFLLQLTRFLLSNGVSFLLALESVLFTETMGGVDTECWCCSQRQWSRHFHWTCSYITTPTERPVCVCPLDLWAR